MGQNLIKKYWVISSKCSRYFENNTIIASRYDCYTIFSSLNGETWWSWILRLGLKTWGFVLKVGLKNSAQLQAGLLFLGGETWSWFLTLDLKTWVLVLKLGLRNSAQLQAGLLSLSGETWSWGLGAPLPTSPTTNNTSTVLREPPTGEH